MWKLRLNGSWEGFWTDSIAHVSIPLITPLTVLIISAKQNEVFLIDKYDSINTIECTVVSWRDFAYSLLFVT